jgi:hypothetical protein
MALVTCAPIPPPAVPTITKYLKESLPDGAVVGFDPTVHPVKFVVGLVKALTSPSKTVRVKPLGVCENLIAIPPTCMCLLRVQP